MPTAIATQAGGVAPPPALSFRLDLTIGSTSYAIRSLEYSPRVGSRAYRLVKGDGTTYDVAPTDHGPVCDCADYIFRRDGLDPAGCKHIRALVGSGLIEDRPASSPLSQSHNGMIRASGYQKSLG